MPIRVKLETYLEKEYEVDCGGIKFRLKPEKVWLFGPRRGRKQVVALFRCPNGVIVRKVLDIIDIPVPYEYDQRAYYDMLSRGELGR